MQSSSNGDNDLPGIPVKTKLCYELKDVLFPTPNSTRPTSSSYIHSQPRQTTSNCIRLKQFTVSNGEEGPLTLAEKLKKDSENVHLRLRSMPCVPMLSLGPVGPITEQGFFPYLSLTVSQTMPNSSPIGLPGINALFYCFCFETRTHVSLTALKAAMSLNISTLNFSSSSLCFLRAGITGMRVLLVEQ